MECSSHDYHMTSDKGNIFFKPLVNGGLGVAFVSKEVPKNPFFFYSVLKLNMLYYSLPKLLWLYPRLDFILALPAVVGYDNLL